MCARDLVGHEELRVRVPAEACFVEADLVLAERRAVRLLGVLLVRAAVADVRADRDERRPVVVVRGLDRGVDAVEVVAVRRRAGCASRRRRSARGRPRTRPCRGAVELDVVVVVEEDELAEPEVAREARGLGRDALLEVAVGGDARRSGGRRSSWPGRLNSAARRRSAIAMPTAFAKPWPSGPVVASTPGVRPYSGWPGVASPTAGTA